MNTTYVRRVAASATAMAIAGLGLLAAPAAVVQAAPADAESHCVAYLTGTAEPRCFDSFAEALEVASGGQLTYGPKNAAEAARTPGFAASVNAANDAANRIGAAAVNDTVISIEYTGSGWTGSDLIWVGTSNCSTSINNTDYEISSMPPGWVNVISSYLTFANCWVKHYENPGFWGNVVGYHGSRSYIGSTLDNATSSQRWS